MLTHLILVHLMVAGPLAAFQLRHGFDVEIKPVFVKARTDLTRLFSADLPVRG